jgi:hypothetical protein
VKSMATKKLLTGSHLRAISLSKRVPSWIHPSPSHASTSTTAITLCEQQRGRGWGEKPGTGEPLWAVASVPHTHLQGDGDEVDPLGVARCEALRDVQARDQAVSITSTEEVRR